MYHAPALVPTDSILKGKNILKSLPTAMLITHHLLLGNQQKL